VIEPTKDDVGRPVVYTGHRHWGGPDFYGVVRSWNEKIVWVVFTGALHSQACRREDLKWLESK
jgi:hypothetical protein